MMSKQWCWKLASSPLVSLICSIGKLPFLLAGPEWGGAHMAWEKYAGIKTEKEHKPRISIENVDGGGQREKRQKGLIKNHKTVLLAFCFCHLQYRSEEWLIFCMLFGIINT